MIFEQVDIKNKVEKGELIYYYNDLFYFSVVRQTYSQERYIDTVLNNMISDIKHILLIFDRIIIAIEHILTLIHKQEEKLFLDFFKNKFIKEALEKQLIILSIWNTKESLDKDYFLEVNKEYLIESEWHQRGEVCIPIDNFPIQNVDKVYFLMREVSKQSKEFKDIFVKDARVYANANSLNAYDKIKTAIENGEWKVETKDAFIPFSIEKFWIEKLKGKLSKFGDSKFQNYIIKNVKSSYYKAGEIGNGEKIFVPLEISPEENKIGESWRKKTYNDQVLSILITPRFLKRILEIIFSSKINLEKVTIDKLISFRQNNFSCFKEFQKCLINTWEEITAIIEKTETIGEPNSYEKYNRLLYNFDNSEFRIFLEKKDCMNIVWQGIISEFIKKVNFNVLGISIRVSDLISFFKDLWKLINKTSIRACIKRYEEILSK